MCICMCMCMCMHMHIHMHGDVGCFGWRRSWEVEVECAGWVRGLVCGVLCGVQGLGCGVLAGAGTSTGHGKRPDSRRP